MPAHAGLRWVWLLVPPRDLPGTPSPCSVTKQASTRDRESRRAGGHQRHVLLGGHLFRTAASPCERHLSHPKTERFTLLEIGIGG